MAPVRGKEAPPWSAGWDRANQVDGAQLGLMLAKDDPEAHRLFAKWLDAAGWELLANALNVLDKSGTTLHELDYFPATAIARLRDSQQRAWHMKTFVTLGWFPWVGSIWRSKWLGRGTVEYWLEGQRIVRVLANASAVRAHLARVADGKVKAISGESDSGRSAAEILRELRREHSACRDAAELFAAMPDDIKAKFEPLRAVRQELEEISVECAFSLHASLVDFGTRLDDNDAHRDKAVRAWWKSWTDTGYDYGLNVLLNSFCTEGELTKLHYALQAAANAFNPDEPKNIAVLRKLGALPGPGSNEEHGWYGAHMDVRRTHHDLVTFRDAYGKAEARMRQAGAAQHPADTKR